ncbi:calcium-binding protein 39-like isoform X3 [Arachis ipaensis]|uniref:calcium-binding protein 39-like isoform X3 n=1 Tax=Arachis ipaensis TaxID=130454 RepID=UPI000A2B68B8|nr:calcium-binding protein 39-like isoform X3 [Arachis ipaensis]
MPRSLQPCFSLPLHKQIAQDPSSLPSRYILESASFVLFFKFVELPTFDVASDAFFTFKHLYEYSLQDLLTKHGNVVYQFLTAHYDEEDMM